MVYRENCFLLKHMPNWSAPNPQGLRNRFVPAIIWLIVLLALILSPGTNLPSGPKIPGLDKLVHGGLFAILLLLWNRAWLATPKKQRKIKLTTNYLVFGIFLAILVEQVQRHVPERSYDLWDMVANLTGSAVGTVCFYILYKKHSRLV